MILKILFNKDLKILSLKENEYLIEVSWSTKVNGDILVLKVKVRTIKTKYLVPALRNR